MIVLDTDVLTLIQRGVGPDYDRLAHQLRAHESESLAVTIISFEEQARGWLAQAAAAKAPADQISTYRRLHALLIDYAGRTLLDFTPEAADTYVSLRRTYRRHGAADLKIAAIVLAHKALLVSGNARDFSPLAGLRFEPFRHDG